MPFSKDAGSKGLDSNKSRRPGIFARLKSGLRGDDNQNNDAFFSCKTPSAHGVPPADIVTVTTDDYAVYEPPANSVPRSISSGGPGDQAIFPRDAKSDATAIQVLFPSHFSQSLSVRPTGSTASNRTRSSDQRSSNASTKRDRHLDLVAEMLRSIAGNDSASKRRIALNGLDLSLAEFIAIARFGATCEPSRSCEEQVVENHRVVQAKISELTKGEDGPRNDPAAAQQALTGFLCGIMPGESTQNSSGDTSHNATKSQLSNGSTADFASTVAQAHTLPPAWVRAAMLLKMNSLLRAKSGLPWEVIETLARMLSDELTPMVPSQGSISANGDTSPLSYVALAMTGNSRVSVLKGKGETSRTFTGSEALQVANIAALELSSQELQCLTTGTSLSCAVAAHSLADVHTLMLLAQLVIAANAEVVMASRKPYDTLVSDQSRPHSGQIEIAANLRSFLSGSHFTHLDDDSPFSALAHCLQLALQLSAQDAASLAKIGEDLFPNQHLSVSSSSSLQTAPQWLGPPLEDLLHAHRNLSTEMNSCTETPVMDPGAARLLSSGNSQAMTVSNASEKIRDVAAHIGRILHALHEEITSSSSPSGLPANLSLAEPSIEVGFKGVSIGCAALASELGFQATRSGHFAQSAGSDNANLGSLALLSSRSTASSVETLTKLVCNAMLMVCQALDVRTCLIAHLRLFATELSLLIGLSDDVFKAYASNDVRSQINRASSDSNVSEEKAVRRQMLHKLTAVVALALMRHPSLDSTERANIAAQHGARAMLEFDLDLELEEGKRSEESSRQAEVPAPSSRKQDVLDVGKDILSVTASTGHSIKQAARRVEQVVKEPFQADNRDKDGTNSDIADSRGGNVIHGHSAADTTVPSARDRVTQQQMNGSHNGSAPATDGQRGSSSQARPNGHSAHVSSSVKPPTRILQLVEARAQADAFNRGQNNGTSVKHADRSSLAKEIKGGRDSQAPSSSPAAAPPRPPRTNRENEAPQLEAQTNLPGVGDDDARRSSSSSRGSQTPVPTNKPPGRQTKTPFQVLVEGAKLYAKAHSLDVPADDCEPGDESERDKDRDKHSAPEARRRNSGTLSNLVRSGFMGGEGSSSNNRASSRSTILSRIDTITGKVKNEREPSSAGHTPSELARVLIQVLEPVLAHIIQRTFERSRDAYFQASRQSPDAEDELANQVRQTPNRKRAPTDYSREGKLPTSPLPFLGTGTTALYRFVRIQLGLKMHRSAALDQPSHVSSAAPASRSADDEVRKRGVNSVSKVDGLSNGSGARRDRAGCSICPAATTDSYHSMSQGSSAAETGSQHRPSQGVPSQGRHAHGSSQGRQQAAAENHSTSRSKNKKRPTTGESSRGNANGNGRRNVNHNSKKDNAHVRGRNGEQAHRGTTATQGQGDEDAPIRTLGDELSLLYEAVRSPQVILDAFDRVLPLP